MTTITTARKTFEHFVILLTTNPKQKYYRNHCTQLTAEIETIKKAQEYLGELTKGANKPIPALPIGLFQYCQQACSNATNRAIPALPIGLF